MTIVVKVGGASGNEVAPVLDDLARRTDYVLVHGGSEEVDRLGQAIGRPSEYYTSPSGVASRRSDPEHLSVVVMAIAGTIQTEIVADLVGRGVRAVGLSGVDGGLLRARRKEGARALVGGHVVTLREDRSGTIEAVNTDLLHLLLDAGWIPVVGPPAVSGSGEVLNVDADRVAGAIASALHADALVLLTNVPGLLRDRSDPTSVIRSVSRADLAIVLPFAEGRMRKKVLAARDALEGAVPRVVIAPSQGADPVDRALQGNGTVFA